MNPQNRSLANLDKQRAKQLVSLVGLFGQKVSLVKARRISQGIRKRSENPFPGTSRSSGGVIRESVCLLSRAKEASNRSERVSDREPAADLCSPRETN